MWMWYRNVMLECIIREVHSVGNNSFHLDNQLRVMKWFLRSATNTYKQSSTCVTYYTKKVAFDTFLHELESLYATGPLMSSGFIQEQKRNINGGSFSTHAFKHLTWLSLLAGAYTASW